MYVVLDSILQPQKIKLSQILRINLSVVIPMKKLKFRHLLQMIKMMKTPTTEAAVNMRNYNMIENMKMNIIINLFIRRLKYEKHAVIQKHWLVSKFWILRFKN